MVVYEVSQMEEVAITPRTLEVWMSVRMMKKNMRVK